MIYEQLWNSRSDCLKIVIIRTKRWQMRKIISHIPSIILEVDIYLAGLPRILFKSWKITLKGVIFGISGYQQRNYSVPLATLSCTFHELCAFLNKTLSAFCRHVFYLRRRNILPIIKNAAYLEFYSTIKLY